MAERQFGPYRLVRQIAVGGMAEIHLAKTKGIAGFEKYVALKMIHPNYAEDEQFIQMLVDEAKIAVQLNHGNIAQTFDLGRVGDTFYITMEYVDGADLYKILRRGSEMDGYEMPLDVCAFIAKEVASALDHAHRKRDHSGKTLGIVHRDVSPQNVLISYSGEVKLVDFGIAKATMKVRQTAVGVIKGKYYYMSPEQAWGDQIDYRSDIFSAGIVLYEMITGQMLYLEEDLTRLLEMVRKADIAPPSTLRRGVPPQLEKIVMHALAKDRRDRYQSAGDFATDLERFLHAYSPVFTAAKISNVMKQVIGEPMAVNEEVEERDGPLSTHTLTSDDLIQDKDELKQDENSVIFRVADLRPKSPTEGRDAPRKKQPTGAAPVVGTRPKQPTGSAPVAAARPKQPTGGVPAGPRVTRQADISEPSRPRSITNVPSSIPKIAPQPVAKKAPTPPAGQRQAQRPRDANEVTRQVEPILPGPGNTEDSGLLGLTGPGPTKQTALAWKKHDAVGTHPGDDLENIGDSTMIGAPSGFGGFMMDNAAEDGDGATMISAQPPSLDDTNENDALDTGTFAGETQNDVTAAPPRRDAPSPDDDDDDGDSEDGPTVQRDFRESAKPRVSSGRAAPPPALAAKIHAPAVSEIRKPRASRKTPHAGIAQGNVLQAIVGAKPSEPMPTPRAAPVTPSRNDDSGAMTMPERPSPLSAAHPDLDGAAQATVLEAGVQSTVLERGPMQQRTMLGQTSPLAGAQRPGGSQPPTNRPATPSQPMPVRPGPSQPPANAPQVAFSGYATDASGMPLSTPPTGSPTVPPSGQLPAPPGAYGYQGYPGQQPGYPPQPAWPNGAPPAYAQPYTPPGQSGNYMQQVSPGALYQLQPTGAPPPQPMTLTGQLRLFEADELADKYKLSTGAPKWLKIAIASVIAISLAAGVTFFIIKATRDTAPKMGSVHVESVPPGAEVVFDGTRIAGSTPLTIDGVPTGTRHDVRVELAHYKAYSETVDIPKKGGEIAVRATMEEVTGKLTVITQPDGVEIRLDGVLKGKAPTTITGIEMSSAKKLELRLEGYAPVILDLNWPANGEIGINQRMVK